LRIASSLIIGAHVARKNSKRAKNTIGAQQLQGSLCTHREEGADSLQHFAGNNFDYSVIICIIPYSSFAIFKFWRPRAACEVEGAVEVRRRLSAGAGPVARNDHRIIEHELDMVRRCERAPVVSGGIARFFKWLMPTRRPVGPPMRSIARELEEAFPAGDN
jgi:hypothetical protein